MNEMRKKTFWKELLLPAFWVVVFIVSGQQYDKARMQDAAAANVDATSTYLKKMSNYTKSQARYLWFYILPDVSGNKIIKQGI